MLSGADHPLHASAHEAASQSPLQGEQFAKRYPSPAAGFTRNFTVANVKFLAQTDALHNTLSGPATKCSILRAYAAHGDATLSVRVRITRATKPRSRHSKHNGLAETKNAAIMREHVSCKHVSQRLAAQVNTSPMRGIGWPSSTGPRNLDALATPPAALSGSQSLDSVLTEKRRGGPSLALPIRTTALAGYFRP